MQDLEVVLQLEQPTYSLADEVLVVGEHEPDRHPAEDTTGGAQRRLRSCSSWTTTTTNRKLARDVLRAGGFSTLEAGSGRRGNRSRGEHRPDVVLMDLRLPDMDGADAARQLCASAAYCRDPDRRADVVGLRAGGEWVREAGFAGYLEKPISVREFANQVRAYCLGGARDRAGRSRCRARRGSRSVDRRYPVVLPSVRDPRLHLAAVIVSLQILGQVAFDFRLSIAQILISIGTCAAARSLRSSFDGSTRSSGRRARSSPGTASHSSSACRAPSTATGGARTAGGSSPGRRRIAALEVRDPVPRAPRLQPVELRARPVLSAAGA